MYSEKDRFCVDSNACDTVKSDDQFVASSICPTGITYIIPRSSVMPVAFLIWSALKSTMVAVPSPSAVAWRQMFWDTWPA